MAIPIVRNFDLSYELLNYKSIILLAKLFYNLTPYIMSVGMELNLNCLAPRQSSTKVL